MYRTVQDRPFEPGHDVIPTVWAGRSHELNDWANTLGPRRRDGLYERGRALLGEPGIGKTALSAKITQAAAAAGDLVVPAVRVPRGANVLSLVAQALADAADAESLGRAAASKAAALLERVRGIAGVSLDAPRPSHNPHVDLRDLLIELGHTAAGQHRVVLLCLDEMQNVRSSNELSQLLTALADALARTYTVHDAAGNPHERYLPIAIYLTALPEFHDEATAAAGATFGRRFKPTLIRGLDDVDLRHALAPFASVEGWTTSTGDAVTMTEDAIGSLLNHVQGDPFLFQLVGAAAWETAPDQQTITVEQVATGFAQVRIEAVAHIERLIARAPERERQMLQAMAELSPEHRTLTQIAERMGMRAANLGSAAQRLEQRGLLIRGRLYRFTARAIEGYLRGEWPPPT